MFKKTLLLVCTLVPLLFSTTQGIANQAPVILDQNPLIMSAGSSLTLKLADLIVADPDNVYPDDFALLIDIGESSLREGVQVTPFPLVQSDAAACRNYLQTGLSIQAEPGFEGILTVPIRVFDGDLQSDIFELEIDVVGSCQSCQDVLAKDPNATSGIYLIDPDLDGPVQPFEVYCNMDIGSGGWVLIDTRTNYELANHAETEELTDPWTQNNAHIPQANWLALREASSEMMVTEPEIQANYVIWDFEPMQNANCVPLVDDLSKTPIFHSEPGCTVSGSDYSFISLPRNYQFTAVYFADLSFPVKERYGAYLGSYHTPSHIAIYVR